MCTTKELYQSLMPGWNRKFLESSHPYGRWTHDDCEDQDYPTELLIQKRRTNQEVAKRPIGYLYFSSFYLRRSRAGLTEL